MAALIAVAMISVPFAAVVGVQDVYADESEELDVKVGDAWGFSATLNSFDDFEEFGESLEDILGELFGEGFTVTDLLEMILGSGDDDDDDEDDFDFSSLFDIGEDDLKILLEIFNALEIIDFNIVIAGIIEVIQADETGYAIAVDAGVSAEVSLNIEENLVDILGTVEDLAPHEYDDDSIWNKIISLLGEDSFFGTGDLLVDLNLSLALMLSGIIKLDPDWNLKHVEFSVDIVGTASLETNIDLYGTLVGIIDAFNNLGDPDYTMPTVEYLDDGTDVFSFEIRYSTDTATYFGKDIIITDTNVMGFTIDVTAPEAILSILSLITGKLCDEGETSLEFSIANVETQYGVQDSSDSSELEFIRSIVSLGNESGLFLEDTGKTAVRNDFRKVEDAYSGLVSEFGPCKVTFCDIAYDEDTPDEPDFVVLSEIDVPFNGKITGFPVLDNVTYDEGATMYKHVGWGYVPVEYRDCDYGEYYNFMINWNPAWKVKGDVNLYPIFAKIHTSLADALDELGNDYEPFHYAKVDISNLTDDGEYLFDAYGTLFVEVYDGNKYLYTWIISGDESDEDDGLITNFGINTLEEGSLFNDAMGEFDGSVLFLNFSSSGPTPSGTAVSYNVEGVFEDGMEVYVYLVLEDDDGAFLGLKLMGVYVVDGNAVLFNVPHCSVYALNAIPQPSDPSNDGPSTDDNPPSGEGSSSDGGLSTNVYMIVAVAAILLVAGVAYVMFSRRG